MILKILSSATEVGMTSIIWKVFIELNENFDIFFLNIFEQCFMNYWRPYIIFVLYAFLFLQPI